MKIIIADDHSVIREGLAALLNFQADMEVVATAANGEEARDLVKKHRPDIILLDIEMTPGESGLLTAERIHREFPETKIIMMTMHDDREYLLYTIKNGASGYTLKNAPEGELIEAIRTVTNGGIHLSKEMVPHLVNGFIGKNHEDDDYLKLREREIEILTLIAKGYGNKEIADKLFISVKTVETHKINLMTKLNLKTRPELVEYALRKRLL
ncbi:MAG: response regulator transcription factor [Peptococcaceae bacterium]|nr:response regulator transcription factor [Peptococcaceae bacterium]